MTKETEKQSLSTAEKLKMTKEQAAAYDEFIDYMVKLYHEYGYLIEETQKPDSL